MSSMIETRRPITHTKFQPNSTSNLPYSHGLCFFRCRSRVFLHHCSHRFIPNPTSFHPVVSSKPLLQGGGGGSSVWGGSFLRNKKIREYRILANCEDSDSTASSSEKRSESEGQKVSNNPPNSGPKQRREKQGKSQWWWSKKQGWKWQPLIQAQEIGVLLLQLGIVMFVMRLLRPGIPLPGSEPRQQTTFISVPYSEFLSKINSNQVQKVEVDGVHVMFKLKNEGISNYENSEVVNSKFQESESLLRSVTPTTKRIVYTTTRPSDIKTPYEKMLENQVEFGSPDKRSGGFLNSALHPLAKLGTASLGVLEVLKCEQAETITFADVAGVDEAKEELEEIVEFLRNPDRYIRLGARPPRGVLLVGLPGTGKTLLAKAVAGEAEVHLLVVLQIDAVAKSRDGKFRIVSNDEREQTLNQLLTEMDGFDSNSAVIVLGATNRSDVLDPALRRPGRFDRVVMVETPDRNGREAILKVHASKKELPLGEDVDLSDIASMTTGFTGADLANLVNEAALLAGRKNKVVVEKIDFIHAVERSIAGIEKKTAKLQGNEKAVVARHEVGHAVVGTAVANILPRQPRVEKLSILPRSGGALGFTYTPPTNEDRYLLFIDELRGRLVTLLGGRAAEEVVYSGRVSTGALDDIRRATDMAYKAVAEYGLNQTIGPISLATLSGGGMDESGVAPWGRDQGHLVDLVQREVKVLLQSALDVALSVIRANPTVLEGLGAHLEEKEKVEGEELQEWLKLVVAPKELSIFVRGKKESLLPQQAGF
ncbi:hypothetical protein GH714_035160 [Hevea brasiliensis]|uniref:AAA+ ATPase domain-containing protein n=1 Tax=Hevea brasiliensis TaxID=3981 RepID=A0A6A6MKP3_HEVBR|nr:hypothetical protein GH714_035160 [Hevea brasiliensis]